MMQILNTLVTNLILSQHSHHFARRWFGNAIWHLHIIFLSSRLHLRRIVIILGDWLIPIVLSDRIYWVVINDVSIIVEHIVCESGFRR